MFEVDQNILWYPCAWNDYRDLLFFHPTKAAELKIESLPDIYIHTDRNPIVRKEEGYLHKDGRTFIRILKEEQICLFPDFPYETTLFDLEIASNKFGEYNRQLIYCVVDNFTFFQKVILKHLLKISHLVTICDGKGGLHKYLEFFLGLMGTQYLISDNFGRGRSNGEKFLEEVNLQSIANYYFSIANSPVLLKGISTLTWSEYGHFPVWKETDTIPISTDAIVMKVVRFPFQ